MIMERGRSRSVDVTIRPYRSEDAAALADVRFRSVREAARKDYSPEQVDAWLPSRPEPEDVDRWALDGRLVLVAADAQGRVVGYVDVESDGHIDHLFCAPEAIGHGVGARLYDAVERAAADQDLRRLYVEASEAARRMFERKGFVVTGRREWELRGVRIHNYAMVKELRAGSIPDP